MLVREGYHPVRRGAGLRRLLPEHARRQLPLDGRDRRSPLRAPARQLAAAGSARADDCEALSSRGHSRASHLVYNLTRDQEARRSGEKHWFPLDLLILLTSCNGLSTSGCRPKQSRNLLATDLLTPTGAARTSSAPEYRCGDERSSPPDTGALPQSVTATAGQGGLPRLEIATPQRRRRSMRTAPTSRAGSRRTAAAPVLWMSDHSFWQDGKPIRGGVPICFPWFGPHRAGLRGPGARLRPPGGLDAGRARSSAATSAWPPTFALEAAELSRALAVSLPRHLRGRRRIDAVDEPRGREPRRAGVHVRRGAPHLLHRVRHRARDRLRPRTHAAISTRSAASTERTQDDMPIRFTGETDRVYLETMATCVDRRPRPAAPHRRDQGQLALDRGLESLDRQGAARCRTSATRSGAGWCASRRRTSERPPCTLAPGRAPSHDGVAGRRVTLIAHHADLPAPAGDRLVNVGRPGAPPARCS